MKKIVTKDGSTTFYNESVDENYHSLSGAEEEAVKKFTEPCKIAELAKSGKVAILDVCFGIGYNSCAAIDAAKRANPDCEIEIVALENDPEILHVVSAIDTNFEFYDFFKQIPDRLEDDTLIIDLRDEKAKISIRIYLTDAQDTIRRIDKKFDAVFLDPFSPKKCPELWTTAFFKDIKSLMRPAAILATYSCARVVRDNLREAGFRVEDGPIVGRRAPGTLAKLNL